ncbi:MAG: DUF3592 domain-containing protein [Bryobacterales bacterium]|nr:DUF3592 domain-containing protein [Bryobacterales bacterium]
MRNGQDSEAKRSWMAEGAAWIMVLTGIVLAIAAGRETASMFAAPQAWVDTEATVVRTRVREVRHRAPMSLRQATAGFQVTQEVVYFRKGSRYQESVSLGMFPSEVEAQTEARNAARPGSTLTIWVDAANPAQIRLQPAGSGSGGLQVPAAFARIAASI